MSTSAYAPAMERTQDKVVKRQYKPKRDWAKWGLATYFIIFLIFLYTPMVLMAVLSFQGYDGGVTFPFVGPAGLDWWRSIFQSEIHHGQQVVFTNADAIRSAGQGSLWVSLAAGAIVAFMAFTLSVAFRRRFRGDGIAFYVIMLALMTPGFLLGLGTQIFWKSIGQETSLWHTALGTNTVWGIPFGFLVMMAIWNRYDDHIDEAARDLGANPVRTFSEVTLPLVWTGIFGALLFGFTLTWNDYDRTVLNVVGDPTLPLRIVGLIQESALRPDLYALGTATTFVSLAVIATFLIVLGVRAKFRRTPVTSVEEELGLGGGIDAEAAEQVVEA
jgi:putative spermidine/putrescine transport system permease protein